MDFTSLSKDNIYAIANFLDLASLYRFSLTCSSVHAATAMIPVSLVVIRELRQALLVLPERTNHNLPLAIKRIVSGNGTSELVMLDQLFVSAIQEKNNLKNINKGKRLGKNNLTLNRTIISVRRVHEIKRNILQLMFTFNEVLQLDDHSFGEMILDMVLAAFENGFVSAVSFLLPMTYPSFNRRMSNEVTEDDNGISNTHLVPSVEDYCVKKDVIEQMIRDSLSSKLQGAHGQSYLPFFTLLVSHLASRRRDQIEFGFLKLCLKDSLICTTNLQAFPVVLSQLIKYYPVFQEVNELLEAALFHLAQQGNVELTEEILTMLQLRARFKQLRTVQERAQQQERQNGNDFNRIDERLINASLDREEREFRLAAGLLKRSILLVMQVATRYNQYDLVEIILFKSKISVDIDDEMLNEFFKSTVKSLDTNVLQLILSTKRIEYKEIAHFFVDCSRRNFVESMKVLLESGLIKPPTIEVAKEFALRNGFKEMLAILTPPDEDSVVSSEDEL